MWVVESGLLVRGTTPPRERRAPHPPHLSALAGPPFGRARAARQDSEPVERCLLASLGGQAGPRPVSGAQDHSYLPNSGFGEIVS